MIEGQPEFFAGLAHDATFDLPATGLESDRDRFVGAERVPRRTGVELDGRRDQLADELRRHVFQHRSVFEPDGERGFHRERLGWRFADRETVHSSAGR